MSSSVSATVTSSATASASTTSSSLVDSSSSASFKIVGICLAVGSGLLIGTSFVIKKKGLLNATQKYGNKAGEGHAYLKSWLWWLGMCTMILGEICNFVAYAFTEAILVTPMGALSVVVAAILSHFILNEKLTFFGWIGCTLCIMGAVILALNAPEEQSVTTIAGFKDLFFSAGFLAWASILIVGSLVTIFWVAPRWGRKSMLPYIGICSLIGGISVSCTQGLGSSIVTSIEGDSQIKNWFFWFLFVFVVVTLLTEINYLNKALELFNTSMVVPVYFCFFSSATLITSFILYQGLNASAVSLITMVLGFLVTCLGITLLQLSKVDPGELGDKLDRKSTILMEASRHPTEDMEKGQVTSYEDPGMDALRGGFGAVGSIIRARSVNRKLSSASTMTGGQYGLGKLSTHGLGHLERFQLSDNPMPSDAMSQVSIHTAKSPSVMSHSGRSFADSHDLNGPRRSKSHIKFDEEHDIVHQYQYDRSHPTSPLRAESHDYRHFPQPGTQYPPVMEEEEEDVFDKEGEVNGRFGSRRTKLLFDDVPPVGETIPAPPASDKPGYGNPYDIYPARANAPNNTRRTSGGNGIENGHPRGLAGIFSFQSGPDLSLNIPHKQRQTSRTREREYPSLSKKDRDDKQELEERQALVDDSDSGERERSDGGSSSGSGAASDGEAKEDDEPPFSAISAISGVSTKATIGMGQRVQVGSRPAQVQVQDTVLRKPVPTLESNSGPGSGSGSGSKKGGVKGPRKLPGIPGFSAGPPYDS